MSKTGRPSKYQAEYAEQVYKLCLLGATDEQLADFFGVVVSTIHLWAGEHEAFSEARKNGKLAADANVAEALYHRALGYQHPEEKIFQHDGEIIRADTIKQYPPDTAAAFIWLKNRQPQDWRDKREVEFEDKTPTRELTPDVALRIWEQMQRIRGVERIEKLLAQFAAKNGREVAVIDDD